MKELREDGWESGGGGGGGGEDKVDELVQRVSLYRALRWPLHGYVLPFLGLYAGWTYVWLGWYGLWQLYEGGLVGLAAIACAQILLCLCCHWSVHVQCFVTCRRVSV